MRTLLLTIALTLIGVSAADAQTAQDFVRVSMATFIDVCVDTRAERGGALQRLRAGGWTEATVADIPETRRGARDQTFVQLQGGPPSDAAVFIGRTPQNDVMVVVLGTRTREQGRGGERRTYAVSVCSLYALGVTPQALAGLLYPNDSLGRAVFIDAPIASSSLRGRSFTVAASRPSLEGAYSSWQSMGYFHNESAPLN